MPHELDQDEIHHFASATHGFVGMVMILLVHLMRSIHFYRRSGSGSTLPGGFALSSQSTFRAAIFAFRTRPFTTKHQRVPTSARYYY